MSFGEIRSPRSTRRRWKRETPNLVAAAPMPRIERRRLRCCFAGFAGTDTIRQIMTIFATSFLNKNQQTYTRVPKPLKINSPLPQREMEICQRFREARLELRWKQPDLADELRVPRSRLANYEYAKAPVKFLLGYTFCKLLNISLRWLATGKMPKQPFTPIAPSLLNEINVKSQFSAVYDGRLSSLVEARLKELAKDAGVTVESLGKHQLVIDQRRLGVSAAESHLYNVVELIQQFATAMTDDEKLAFAFKLERESFAFSRELTKIEAKYGLTKKATYGKNDGVINHWQESKRQIQKAVFKPGSKSKLAKYLRVDLTQLSKWLTDSKAAREPGAEYTLKMIHWVEHPELQK